ncbi:MAG: hypothetical protein HYT76_03490 [Deltaproteobacteria bacterium]|nr:hypothetical protein [Deltaproteobacteria bacterium]
MVAPVTVFGFGTRWDEKRDLPIHANPAPDPNRSSFQNVVLAGTLIGVTCLVVASAVASRKPPLKSLINELTNRLFPIGPQREWLLRGWPHEHVYLPHLPSLPPNLVHLATSENPRVRHGIEQLGTEWYRALEHRYGSSLNMVLAAERNPEIHDALLPEIERDKELLEKLIALYRELKKNRVYFSDMPQQDLDDAIELLSSITS